MHVHNVDAPAELPDVYVAYQPLVGPFERLEQRLVGLGADLPDILRLHTVVCLHVPGIEASAVLHHLPKVRPVRQQGG